MVRLAQCRRFSISRAPVREAVTMPGGSRRGVGMGGGLSRGGGGSSCSEYKVRMGSCSSAAFYRSFAKQRRAAFNNSVA